MTWVDDIDGKIFGPKESNSNNTSEMEKEKVNIHLEEEKYDESNDKDNSGTGDNDKKGANDDDDDHDEKKSNNNKNNSDSKVNDTGEGSDGNQNDIALSVSEASRLHSGIFSVRGTISSISELHKMITSFELLCINLECDFQAIKEYKNPIQIAQLENKMECPKCNSTLETTPQYVNAVTIELRDSESFNDLDKIRVYLFDKDTCDIIVGENVIIKGEIVIIRSSKKGKAFSVLYAASIIYDNKEELELTDLDIQAIKRFRSRFGNDVIKKLVSMAAPSIVGHDKVKEGILLSAANTNEDEPDKRRRIHILLVGPPGLAKTAFLRQGIKMVSKSSVENAQTSSGLSLLAIVDKDEDTFVLRLGPVPRARGAICAIDELNRMTFQDQDKLLAVMQEGSFSNNKYGINARIRSPTTIIATANPVDSTNGFDIDEKIDFNQILIMPPVLDRFDLKFIFKQMKSQAEIREFTYQLSDKEDKKIPDYSLFMRKYILYCKKFQPKISDEAKSILNEYYIGMTQFNSVSPRVRESLFNLTRARAKVKFKNIADAEDAKETVRYYDSIIKDYNNDVYIPEDPRERALRGCIEILRDLKKGISLDELIMMICEKIEQVKRYLSFGNKPLRMRDNKKVRNLYEMLVAHKNIKRIQEKPIVLQWFDDHE